MVTLGTDSHKATHTVVATDDAGRQLGQGTFKANEDGHLKALQWAGQWQDPRWEIAHGLFEKRADLAVHRRTLSNEAALQWLPEGGSVLDVGCGAGGRVAAPGRPRRPAHRR